MHLLGPRLNALGIVLIAAACMAGVKRRDGKLGSWRNLPGLVMDYPRAWDGKMGFWGLPHAAIK